MQFAIVKSMERRVGERECTMPNAECTSRDKDERRVMQSAICNLRYAIRRIIERSVEHYDYIPMKGKFVPAK